ncbi:hypothetical protein RN001_003767 [Aquatica leii]|uniref:Uncharacterized protein n=1 Tax=Aquatica leii TaxID=1421715 RepID=A0AAN7PRH7_9COLE|nr:hypothetical protein RN001_003767 [Aquatica leii]
MEKPELITSTRLRKYIAAVCKIFDLSDNEYDWLARHLVHRQFYEDIAELTKVSQLSMAVDAGETHKFAGKKLEDIELKDLPPIEDDTEENDLQENTSNVDVHEEPTDTISEQTVKDLSNVETKILSKLKRRNVIKKVGETDSLISEDKSSGSEPDTSSDSSTKSKTKEWWEEENTNVNSGSAAQLVENWLEKNNRPVSKTALVKNNSEKGTKKIKILQNVIIKSETNEKAQVIEREEENLTTGESMSDVNSGITFSISENVNGKRIRNKRNWCPYCLNAFQNMARHFEQRHENEIDVAKVLAMKKRSKERKETFSYIIRAGNFSHNCEVLSCKKGELVLVRRPAETEAATYTFAEFGPCPNCLGFMVKKQLYHHIRTCQHKPKDIFIGKNIVSESNEIMHGIMKADLPPSYTHHILSKIRDDKIGKCCVNDSLIIKFGAMQYEKYHNTQAELIRQTMRQLGVKFPRTKPNPMYTSTILESACNSFAEGQKATLEGNKETNAATNNLADAIRELARTNVLLCKLKYVQRYGNEDGFDKFCKI